MLRTVRNTAAVLFATALVSLPTAATAADRSGPGGAPVVIVNNSPQIAGGDIFNAGRDNIVGSGNSAVQMPGSGAPGVGAPGSSVLTFMLNTGAVPVMKLVSEDPKVGLLPASIRPHAQYTLYALEPFVVNAAYQSSDATLNLRIDASGPALQLSCSTQGSLHCAVTERDGRPQFDVSA